VAVKILHGTYAGNPAVVDRMRVEGQALAQLESPHIVDVLDAGQTEDGRPFFVMPRLVGCSLAEELRTRGYLPADEAVELVLQLLVGLDVAHRAGLVHRDIKVENLFLCKSNVGPPLLKILDFGLTKVLPGTSEVPPGLQTQEGFIIGSPRSMAPEQAQGAAVDARTDLYSAGVVLYQLVAGHDPFHHVSGFTHLLNAHVSEEVRPASEVAAQTIPPELDAVILCALAKRPEDRYPDALAFSSALQHATSVATTERRIRPPAAKGATLLTTCLLVLGSALLSALVILLLGRAR
jgi:serine/threonine-protein kinase